MYIKNPNQLTVNSLYSKIKYTPGSIISGKIITRDNINGSIKLIDGTIIPVIFQNEYNLDKNKYIRFKIEKSHDKYLLLRALNLAEDKNDFEDTPLDSILRDLNLPLEDGREIIKSLVKFNLPATNDNITQIYKNHVFLKNIRNFSDEDIIMFIETHISKEAANNKKLIDASKKIFKVLKSVDIDFLSFLIENDLPQNLDGILKSHQFINNGLDSGIIDLLKKLTGKNNFNFRNIDSINLSNLLNKEGSELLNSSMEGVSSSDIKKILDNLNILKNVKNNYNIFYLNSNFRGTNYKNCVIVKNKVPNRNYFDTNNAKFFISVETPNFDLVESYVLKKNTDLSINFKVQKKFIEIFNKNSNLLKTLLSEKNYNLVSISIEEQIKPNKIVDLSLFFNDNIIIELDVKV